MLSNVSGPVVLVCLVMCWPQSTLFDAAVSGQHPSERDLRRQSGPRVVVNKLSSAADRPAALNSRDTEAATAQQASKGRIRKRAGGKGDAGTNNGTGRGGIQGKDGGRGRGRVRKCRQ
jgi:hypothetical protein